MLLAFFNALYPLQYRMMHHNVVSKTYDIKIKQTCVQSISEVSFDLRNLTYPWGRVIRKESIQYNKVGNNKKEAPTHPLSLSLFFFYRNLNVNHFPSFIIEYMKDHIFELRRVI